MRRSVLLTCICALLCLGSTKAMADSITLDGISYRDVLVYQSSSIYYVKLPEEGRVLSVPVDRVDASTVEINNDPYYRDELKAKYEQARLRLEPTTAKETKIDPAFIVQEKKKSHDIGNLLGPTGSGEPLGISASALKGTLGGARLKFSEGQSLDGQKALIGVSRNKQLLVEIIGPPADVTSVFVRIRGTAKQANKVTQNLATVGPLIHRVAPWVGDWLQNNYVSIFGGGQIQNAQDGILSYVLVTRAGDKITIEITVMAA